MRTIMPIHETGVFSWEYQAGHYPVQGKGIQYFRANVDDYTWVDCLLYYGDDLKLQGILNYYPFNFPPYQKKGSVNILVRMDRRRKGIASALLSEAMTRFKIDLMQQDYTPLGNKFINSYIFIPYKSIIQCNKHS